MKTYGTFTIKFLTSAYTETAIIDSDDFAIIQSFEIDR